MLPVRFATLAVATLLGLAACADPAGDDALAAQQALVGMPKGTLMSCAGVPVGHASAGGQEFLTYRSGSITVIAPPPPPIGFGWGGYGWGRTGWHRHPYDYDPWDYYPPGPPDVRDERCEATFTLDKEVVRQLVYRATSRGSCAPIIRNCLSLVPQRTITNMPPTPPPGSAP